MSDHSISIDKKSNHKIEFRGTGGELLPIILLNLLLTIITLGIYRFWAKTNVRDFIWSKTYFDGEPFEYTGTGGELFKGFLTVFILFMLAYLGFVFLLLPMLMSLPPVVAGILGITLYLAMIWLMGVAVYRAHYYRMSRTKWRGIRGAQIGSSSSYGWLTLKYLFLLIVTFGLATPYVTVKLFNHITSNKRMGSGVFSSTAEVGRLYKTFIPCLILAYICGGYFGFQAFQAKLAGNDAGFFINYILAFLSVVIIFIWYEVKLMNQLYSGIKFQNMEFNFNLSVISYVKFALINLVIIIFTLGIAAPIVMMRWSRLTCENLSFSGNIDLESITQSPEEGPSMGEGLVEAFDIDV